MVVVMGVQAVESELAVRAFDDLDEPVHTLSDVEWQALLHFTYKHTAPGADHVQTSRMPAPYLFQFALTGRSDADRGDGHG